MIAVGDLVLLYNSARMQYLVSVPAKGRFSTHRGNIEFAEVVGRQYGDSVKTHMGLTFFLLRPTLADVAMRVRRTTTIVYPKDTGTMLLEAGVFPGARVIEVGSGSGALAITLANFVRPDGRIYSYERRPEFSANARENVARAGLLAYCEFVVGDPEHEGFAQKDVDAVFLDVPEPWTLTGAARRALKTGNSLAAIVPTVEQLRRTVSALEMDGFVRIRVKEMFEREMFVRNTGTRPADRMVGHTVYTILAHKTSLAGVREATDTRETGGREL
ncbi:MAG: tRNA (adenine-N1)-methyltransferase [candidate division WOR-3 bacterium]